MSLASSVKKFIQAIPPWVTGFNAHLFFAFSLIVIFPFWWLVALAEVIFAYKEFYIDPHDETTPQPFWTNVRDFGSYTLGVALALLVHLVHFHLHFHPTAWA